MSKEIEQEALNKALSDQFATELGQKAIVSHESLAKGNPEREAYVAELRSCLADMALDLQRVDLAPKEHEYLGSFSVHVYASELLRQFSFVGVTNPHKTTHPIAEAAISKLKQDMNEYFGKKRQKLRSGF